AQCFPGPDSADASDSAGGTLQNDAAPRKKGDAGICAGGSKKRAEAARCGRRGRTTHFDGTERPSTEREGVDFAVSRYAVELYGPPGSRCDRDQGRVRYRPAVGTGREPTRSGVYGTRRREAG